MMWKGTSAARVMYIIGVAYAAVSMAIAADIMQTNNNNVFVNDTALSTRSTGGLFEEEEFDLPLPNHTMMQSRIKGESAMQLRNERIRQRNRKRNKYKNKRQKKKKKNNGKPIQRPANPPSASQPNNRPPSRPSSSCFTVDTYNSIDDDIADIQDGIDNDMDRSHWLGGIVRLAAHDFMDYDRRDTRDPMGPDGCIDPGHPSNDGLESIWCPDCPLRLLYVENYSYLSRADFWIASSNAVIRQTSIDNRLDLKDTFMWGRKDRDTCRGSGQRLPQTKGCDEVEDVFLRKMGLEYKDAVALLGAHTLGRGNSAVSITSSLFGVPYSCFQLYKS